MKAVDAQPIDEKLAVPAGPQLRAPRTDGGLAARMSVFRLATTWRGAAVRYQSVDADLDLAALRPVDGFPAEAPGSHDIIASRSDVGTPSPVTPVSLMHSVPESVIAEMPSPQVTARDTSRLAIPGIESPDRSPVAMPAQHVERLHPAPAAPAAELPREPSRGIEPLIPPRAVEMTVPAHESPRPESRGNAPDVPSPRKPVNAAQARAKIGELIGDRGIDRVVQCPLGLAPAPPERVAGDAKLPTPATAMKQVAARPAMGLAGVSPGAVSPRAVSRGTPAPAAQPVVLERLAQLPRATARETVHVGTVQVQVRAVAAPAAPAATPMPPAARSAAAPTRGTFRNVWLSRRGRD